MQASKTVVARAKNTFAVGTSPVDLDLDLDLDLNLVLNLVLRFLPTPRETE